MFHSRYFFFKNKNIVATFNTCYCFMIEIIVWIASSGKWFLVLKSTVTISIFYVYCKCIQTFYKTFDKSYILILILLKNNRYITVPVISYSTIKSVWFFQENHRDFRLVLFHNFMLIVVHSLFTGGSPNAGRRHCAYVGRTVHEKREDNK